MADIIPVRNPAARNRLHASTPDVRSPYAEPDPASETLAGLLAWPAPWPVLTVWQPWASAIGPGPNGKDTENRGWSTAYRGPFWIHAGMHVQWDAPAAVWHAAGLVAPPPGRVGRAPWLGSLVRGAVVAVARLADCHEDCGETCSPWAIQDQYHFALANRHRLPDPVKAVGQRKFWRLPEDVEAQARKQLEATHA